MKTSIAILVAFLLVSTAPALADSACRTGGVVATSQSGGVTVTKSTHGCRAFPVASFTVAGGVRDYTVERLPYHEQLSVSDTGRTLLLAPSTNRVGETEVTVYRNGRPFGTYTLIELMGPSASSHQGAEVRLRIEGLEILITAISDGAELRRIHLRTLRRQPTR